MAILTGLEIAKQIGEGHIRIGNYDPLRIQPNSYDLTLGNKISFYGLVEYAAKVGLCVEGANFETYGMSAVCDVDSEECEFVRGIPILDSMKENAMYQEEIPEEGYILLPRILYIVETKESVWSDKFVTEVSGISSLARLGISVHKTAGYANIGHEFKWVLEVEVTHAIKIYPGMRIGQMYFHTTSGDTDYQYHGKYTNTQMNDELCGSLSYLDPEIERMEKEQITQMNSEVSVEDVIETVEEPKEAPPIDEETGIEINEDTDNTSKE